MVYDPAVQSEHQVHGSQTEEPVKMATVDGPHGRHVAEPTEDAKVLMGHGTHTVRKESEEVPTVQGVHAEAELADIVPGAHC